MGPELYLQRGSVVTLAESITVLIVDDHPVSADGLRTYLETAEDIQVATICYYGEDALSAVERYAPDIVIIDLELEGSRINGIEVARRLRQQYPNLRLLVVSAYSDPPRVLGAVSAGIDGYVIKTSSRIEIIQAVYAVMSGVNIWDPRVNKIIQLYIGNEPDRITEYVQDSYDPTGATLTEREWEVLPLLAAGYSNQEIANHLIIAEKTVKTHVSHIFRKIGVSDRSQAKVWYYVYRSAYEQ